jgi:hypothetical protein
MALPKFYYSQGTTYLINIVDALATLIGNVVFQVPNIVSIKLGLLGGSSLVNASGVETIISPFPASIQGWIKGLDGTSTYAGPGVYGNGDPFPLMLDTDLWNPVFVPYPAATVLMGPSIKYGVDWIVNDILTSPPGTPVALGGYSQGAAVASVVYNEFRSGRLRNRRSDLRAVVAFGNPMRQVGHTYPGSSGYSGAGDILGDTQTGHGTFHSASTNVPILEAFVSQFSRLQGTEDLFWDFTMPGEVISGIGDSPDGLRVQAFVKESLRAFPVTALIDIYEVLGLNLSGGPSNPNPIMGRLAFAPSGPGMVINPVTGQVVVTDARTGEQRSLDGGGHVCYLFYPPPDANGLIPASGPTCYQIALQYLREVGQQIYDQAHPTVPAPTTKPTYQWFSSLASG